MRVSNWMSSMSINSTQPVPLWQPNSTSTWL
ncbi:hypothetical protein D046_9201, partial [Vibrio parahaemolyticus V-223/04]